LRLSYRIYNLKEYREPLESELVGSAMVSANLSRNDKVTVMKPRGREEIGGELVLTRNTSPGVTQRRYGISYRGASTRCR